MPFRFAILFCCFGVSARVSADVFDVYLAAGQSNMDGRGLKSDLVGPLAVYAAPQPNVLLHYTNPRDPVDDSASRPTYQSGGWVPLAPGYAVQPNFPSGGTIPATRFGPEVSFGRAMASGTSTRRVAIIKVSRGGESLSGAWDPSDGFNGDKGYLYKGLETAVAQAIQTLRDQGHLAEIRGVIWHHGSADSPSTYEGNLWEFIQVVRQAFGDNLPFLIGELAGDTESRLALRAIQSNVAATTDFSGFIPSDGLGVQSDEIHFTASGNIDLGNRFATTMLSTISNLPGDFNRDGVVNNQDFDVWTELQGTNIDARADGNNDGVVDGLDLQIWQAAVPEPSSGTIAAVLLLSGIACFGWRSLRRRQSARSNQRGPHDSD
jgi:iduronate 2-sulfatase